MMTTEEIYALNEPIHERPRRWLTVKIFSAHVIETIKKSNEIIGMNPTEKDGYILICRDSKGIYRAYLPATKPTLLKLKFITHRIGMQLKHGWYNFPSRPSLWWRIKGKIK